MVQRGSERWDHLRAILITAIACIAGVIAAIVASMYTPVHASPNEAAAHDMAYAALVGAIVVQLPVYQVSFEKWGGAKDVLYVAFMTFCLWFVSYGIILTTGAEFF